MSKIIYRITSLEQEGKKKHSDSQDESVKAVKDARFTAVFINGGSGIGPNMIPMESMVKSPILPDLMPYTIQGN